MLGLLFVWLRENARELLFDISLVAAVLWLALSPARSRWEILLHAAIATVVLLRAFFAWRDWRYSPRKLNDIWHRQGSALLHARQDLPVRCGRSPGLTAIDVVANSVHGFWIPVDRSRTLASPGLRMEIVDPIPDAGGFATHFDEICLERAQRIWAEDRDIALFWSGGIDSTTALSALLMQATAADRKRLRVFLRPRSITEYPEFFAARVRDLPHTIITGNNADAFQTGPGRTFSSDVGLMLAAQARHSLIVTGEHGDQIFGSIKLAENPEWIGRPPGEYLSDPVFAGFRDEIARLNAASPVPIQTIDTMLWWWNFAVKWQEISFRSLSDLDASAAFGNIRHFFQTDDFQRWSIANPDLKIRDTLESYKWPAKEFIYKFAKDADYRDHKIKVGSLRVRIGSLLGIDNRYNIIKAGQTSTDESKIRARYGNSLDRFAPALANGSPV